MPLVGLSAYRSENGTLLNEYQQDSLLFTVVEDAIFSLKESEMDLVNMNTPNW